MVTKVAQRRIVILGNFGNRNVGDDTMLSVVLSYLGGIYPKAKLHVFAHGGKIENLIGDPYVFVHNYSVFGLIKIISTSKELVMPIGTSIHNIGKDIRFMRVLLIYLLICCYARILRRKIIFLCIGIGPLETRWAKALANMILRFASLIIVRDKASLEAAQELGVNPRKTLLSFDLGSLLPIRQKSNRIQKGGIFRLGLSLVPYFSTFEKMRWKDEAVASNVAQSLDAWLKGSPLRSLRILIFYGSKREGDASISKLVMHQISCRLQVEIVDYNSDPITVLDKVGECSAFIGMRYHSCLFAYLVGIPVLMIGYHPKIYFLANEIGYMQRVVPINDFLEKTRCREIIYSFLSTPASYVSTLPLSKAQSRTKMALARLEVCGE